MQTLNEIKNIIEDNMLIHLLSGDLTIYPASDQIFVYYKETRLFNINIKGPDSNIKCLIIYPNIENRPAYPMITCKTKKDITKHLNFINKNIEEIHEIQKNMYKKIQ